jgi:cytochrome P450
LITSRLRFDTNNTSHETTAAALTWGLYALAADPNMQSRLRADIVDHVGGHDLSADTMDSMNYLHGFVMEVLRLYPSIMQTVRETTQDTVIDGTVVPRGQMILIPIYAINRSPKFWGEDAEVVRPERWSNGSTTGGAAGQHAFMTFLSGSRVCIGKEFSIRSMKAILVCLLSKFAFEELTPGEKPKMRKDLVCQPQGGMHLRVRRI